MRHRAEAERRYSEYLAKIEEEMRRIRKYTVMYHVDGHSCQWDGEGHGVTVSAGYIEIYRYRETLPINSFDSRTITFMIKESDFISLEETE